MKLIIVQSYNTDSVAGTSCVEKSKIHHHVWDAHYLIISLLIIWKKICYIVTGLLDVGKKVSSVKYSIPIVKKIVSVILSIGSPQSLGTVS